MAGDGYFAEAEGFLKGVGETVLGEFEAPTEHFKEVNKRYEEAFGKKRPDIRHVVVLMLENRTFDGCQGQYMNERYVAGELKRSKWDTDDKDLYEYTNVVNGPDGPVEFPVWSHDLDDPEMMSEENLSTPNGPAGPVEKFHMLNKCTYGVQRPTPEHIEAGPNMAGFANEYYKKEIANPPVADDKGKTQVLKPGVGATDFEGKKSPVMHVYNKMQMTVFSQLMEHYGCSDVHFSSAPCQTWPNRLFAACATCYGYYNNIPYENPKGRDETEYFQSDAVDKMGAIEKMASSYDLDTVFHRLEARGVDWGIYHGQVSLAVATTSLKWHLSLVNRVKTLSDFSTDVAANTLPNFVWLEPDYDVNGVPTDMHPPANVLNGEKLIADIYMTLKSNEKVWKHTLFIVTCDEGVGSFDHVRPPAAVDPVQGHDHDYVCQDDGSPYTMSSNPFTRFGTRVPNLLVSPWIKKSAVVRPECHDSDEPGMCPYPFDHTSIIRTAFDLLVGDPKEHLTERDKVAPSFAPALDLPGPLNHGPSVVCPAFDAKPIPGRSAHSCHSVHFFKHLGAAKGPFKLASHESLVSRFSCMFGM